MDESRLWMAVLEQAVRDADVEKATWPKTCDDVAHGQARWWLTHDSEDLRFVVGAAGLEVERVLGVCQRRYGRGR